MGHSVQESPTTSLQLVKDGSVLACDSSLSAGDSGLTFSLAGQSGQYLIEATASAGKNVIWGIAGGDCTGERDVNSVDKTYTVPTSGTVTLRVVWATGSAGPVYVSPDCSYTVATSSVCDKLIFSEYAEGSSNNKYLEIYNAGSCEANLDDYALASVTNDPTTPGEHENWRAFASGATIAPGAVYIIAHPLADASILAKKDEDHSSLSNGDDGYCLVKGTEASYSKVDCIGDFQADPGSGWDVCGTVEGTMDHTLVRKSTVTAGKWW